jgi:RNA polymerase sigma-70 factor (ECF subfamily)
MISNGDEFELLYDRHHQAIFQLALRLTGNRTWAEDAMQEAMLRIWRARSAQGRSSRQWILRVVANECTRLHLVRQREFRRTQRIAPRPASKPLDPEMVDQLNRGLETLPLVESTLLKLHFECGLSQRKISDVVAMPQQTVSYRLRRALSSLRKAMSSCALA